MGFKFILLYQVIIMTLIISCNYAKNRYSEIKASNISGIVIEKNREKWNHGSKVFKINTGKEIGVESWVKGSYLWE